MKIDRPLWAAGTLLSPQQFQQQARWEAYTNECIAHLALVHPWGILAAEFDKDALRLGKLKADRISVRFQDGTLLDSERADLLPPALDLAQVLPADAQSATLLLALPLEHANGGNCLPMDAKADRPIRYRQDWASVQDIFGNDTESMAVARYALTLRLDGDENGDYLTCPAVRLVRDVQGVWGVDPQFVPPLLQFGAHAALVSYLDRLLTQ
ncbi:MAG: type VI secretion system baseplate subunit TssK, partial [Hafnia alvei]|nr:type VI secretion system baseplate subunit TssK [Hafnia alvei]